MSAPVGHAIMSEMPSKSAERIRVVLLENSPVVREGLDRWLARRRDFTIAAQVGTVREMREALIRWRAGILVMELAAHGADGVAAIREACAAHPKLRVLVFSTYDENLYAERALRAGALGYLMKSGSYDEFIAALRAVAAGNLYVSPRLSLILLGRLMRTKAGSGNGEGLAGLTDRELHVYQLLGCGLSGGEIGRRLGISGKTVQAHRENIKNKLGLHTSGELLRHAALSLGHPAGSVGQTTKTK